MASEKVERLEAEVVRLRKELRDLEGHWSRIHRLWLFGLAAIPTYFVFGGLPAGVVLLCTPALVVIQAYLLTVRRMECRALIQETVRDLDYHRRRAAPPAPSSG